MRKNDISNSLPSILGRFGSGAVHYLKVTFRNMFRYKVQNLISIIGLSVSIACFALCMHLIRSLTDLGNEFPDVNRMYSVADSARNGLAINHQLAPSIAKNFPDVEKYVAVENRRPTLLTIIDSEEEKYMLNTLEVTSSFFDFFSIPFLQALPNAENQINGIVLCESTAKKLFGSIDVAGQKLSTMREYVDPEQNKIVKRNLIYTVCGVIKDFPGNSFFNINAHATVNAVFINDETGNFYPENTPSYSSAISIVMLRKGISLTAFNKKIANYSISIKGPFDRKDSKFHVIPFTNTIKQIFGDMFYVIIYVFGILGFLMLLVSIFNYTSYTVSMFLNKMHECAIRKTVNAGRWHLFFLFFTEISVTIVLSGLLALFWIDILYPFINSLFSLFLTIDAKTIYIQIFQYVALGIVLAFLLCLIPVHFINKMNVTDTLFGGKKRNPKSKTRSVLLGLQLFICIIFVSASVFLYLQLRYVSSLTMSKLTHEEKENIIEVSVSHELLIPHTDAIMSKFKANPNIEKILATGTELAKIGGWITTLLYEEKNLSNDLRIMNVGANYPEFTNTKIIEGRFIADGAKNEIVINEAAKKILGKENVLGEIIQNYKKEGFTIVGVMEDIVNLDTYSELIGMVFFPSNDKNLIYLKVNPLKKKETLAYINETIREFFPKTLDYQLYNLNEKISNINVVENTILKLIFLFAIISIIISLFGVYSSVLLTTERRRKEVAIRKINGATLANIIRLFLNTYLYILVIVAIPAFAIIYLVVGEWLKSYAYHITVSGIVFVLIFIGLNVLLILTVIYQLMKTAKLNPADVIKKN
jgi:ABC-type antimicrobial peptide transport system permease subunit